MASVPTEYLLTLWHMGIPAFFLLFYLAVASLSILGQVKYVGFLKAEA